MKNFKKCGDKNCYSKNQVEAVRVAAMKARNRKLRAYQCDRCFNYHLTSEVRLSK